MQLATPARKNQENRYRFNAVTGWIIFVVSNCSNSYLVSPVRGVIKMPLELGASLQALSRRAPEESNSMLDRNI
jgi:hypothetical protein